VQIGHNKLTLCKYGWMLHNGPYIGKCFELYGQYSESEVNIIRAFVKPGDTVLDIGANIGDLTVPMARLVGSEGRVYAIESNAATFQILCANLALNNLRNVKPINCFVADSESVDTAGPWGKYGFVSAIWGTEIVPVDLLNIETCSFIKIDVDGKELQVIRSANGLIGKCRPVLYFENDARDVSEALFDHVMGLGYDLYWHPAPIFSPDNFFGNPVNHWAPQAIMSLMIVAMPAERRGSYSTNLRPVSSKSQWWSDLQSG
jgi:FkbM family methyltransferase